MHLIVDVRDAMGANTVNTMAETVAPMVEKISGGMVRLRILSNFADLRLARAMVRLTPEALKTEEYEGERIATRHRRGLCASPSSTLTGRRRTTRAS